MRGALLAAALCVGPTAFAQLTRGPYLQKVTPHSIVVVWRTDTPEDSVVRFGTSQPLRRWARGPSNVTEHQVTLHGLAPDTRYYYRVGTATLTRAPLTAGEQSEYVFTTHPVPGTKRPVRFWVVGDDGVGDAAQALTVSRMTDRVSLPNERWPDLFLHLGDMAYTNGTDAEFTRNHFAPHQAVLRRVPLWPTLGNHEGYSSVALTQTGPYFDAYVLPTRGESGGVPSGTEAYYAFDFANVHFVVLDSYDLPRTSTGAMAAWLRSDLSATAQDWVVAYFHHPPYTQGTHSELEVELREMREEILPILEANGVDLVLAGHSHIYERSFLINGAYQTPVSTAGKILDGSAGLPYRKPSGLTANAGTVYVVAGHGGAATGGWGQHPLMHFRETAHGSCLVDVNGNQLTLRNLRNVDGTVSDTFTLIKGDFDAGVVDAGTADGGPQDGGGENAEDAGETDPEDAGPEVAIPPRRSCGCATTGGPELPGLLFVLVVLARRTLKRHVGPSTR